MLGEYESNVAKPTSYSTPKVELLSISRIRELCVNIAATYLLFVFSLFLRDLSLAFLDPPSNVSL
jgi:hypothetical protein